ncbi:MAG: alpha/beta hydrolase [Propionibacteriaceae bacterium]|jgi:pimeloyl-ACP methyl ester carboxylesterase|nr:alpha/beta hydrolase [Propionibacteriaceae bacterium]
MAAVGFGTLGLLVVALGTALWLSPGRPAPYQDPAGNPVAGSISEKIWVEINGEPQGMFIRGRSVSNPVVLFLHGGPGMPEYFLAEKHLAALEDLFVVCYWEQRGAGLSWRPDLDAASVTSAQLVEDAIAVSRYLRERFGQQQVILLAHSWGTFIGIQAAWRAPELYSAYVSVGQISDTVASERLAHSYLRQRYAELGNKSMVGKLDAFPVAESETAARAFFDSEVREQAEHDLGVGTTREMRSTATGIFLPHLLSPAYTLPEKLAQWQAKSFLREKTALVDELFTVNLPQQVPALQIPTHFVSGAHDYTVNWKLSQQYLETIAAPIKEFHLFENSAHSPLFEEPTRFATLLSEITR